MTKCLSLMGRYENNLIFISINFNTKYLKRMKKLQKNYGDILTKVLISELVYVLGF